MEVGDRVSDFRVNGGPPVPFFAIPYVTMSEKCLILDSYTKHSSAKAPYLLNLSIVTVTSAGTAPKPLKIHQKN